MHSAFWPVRGVVRLSPPSNCRTFSLCFTFDLHFSLLAFGSVLSCIRSSASRREEEKALGLTVLRALGPGAGLGSALFSGSTPSFDLALLLILSCILYGKCLLPDRQTSVWPGGVCASESPQLLVEQQVARSYPEQLNMKPGDGTQETVL